MQKIVPHLWFDKEALEAASFYASVFPNSRVTSKSVIENTPSGDCEIVGFEIMGYSFEALSAGPFFKINPSISIMVNFDPSQLENARELIDEVWAKLAESGKPLMPLDKYPFSERYGWIQDEYGFTWQLIYTDPEGEDRPLVIPCLLFVTDESKIAEEATDFYLSVFKNAERGTIVHHPAGSESYPKDSVMFTDFMLEGQWLVAMDGSTSMHDFSFNEAVCFKVKCENQEEIDYYWDQLSAVPESEQCGWVKDEYGVSWQIMPTNMGELMQKNPGKTTPTMLSMKKIIIADLEKAAS